ncbi:PTS mannitol transporter subunit IICB [Cohnella cellulosilytica]|uniref:PTS system mannitol-specific EIICB component n=1 Tax=Cohnella cellulosilytica TaxID=986710 RepID=A0ABW2FFN5_9BACL
MSNLSVQPNSRPGVKIKVQQFGRFLSGMVMPNLGAFIAWGLITALFIPTGWIPNEDLASLVGPTITYLLPLLIAYTGGTMVNGTRGGVLAAIATIGVIVGSDIPMFLGAMIVGPAAAWVIKKFDSLIEGKVKAGFEMLVNNFSAGILGGIMALIAYKGIGPVVTGFSNVLSDAVDWLVANNLIPLANILIEPGKVLFLNNAINHGVLGPIALKEAAETGKSLLFMLESNPGPGLGILIAYWIFGRGAAKQSTPGAIIIHFFGGIHEIYFPYILMNPRLILAAIAGGVTGSLTFSLLHTGLVAAPSPGSIFAYMIMTPKGEFVPVLAGIIVATAVSFAVAGLLLKSSKKDANLSLEEASDKIKQMKREAKGLAEETKKTGADTRKIVFACDAGMGSSAMGASILRKKINQAGLSITVINTAINDLPGDADIVITHETLTDRARIKLPGAEHISITDFLKSPKYDELVQRLSS